MPYNDACRCLLFLLLLLLLSLLFECLDLLESLKSTLFNILLSDARLLAHATEDASRHRVQLERTGELGDATVVHDEYPIVGNNSTQAMRNGQERLTAKLRANSLLDKCICRNVDGSGLGRSSVKPSRT